MAKKLNIVHVAAECAPYVKSGGLGDVVQALPAAQAKLGHTVSTFIPHYGLIKKQKLKTETMLENVPIKVHGKTFKASLKKIINGNGVNIFLVGNEGLFGNKSGLYMYPNEGLRFLFFDQAVLKFLDLLCAQGYGPFARGQIDILHCHDWHTGLIPQLLRSKHSFPRLKDCATLFTIHNLVFQGPSDWWIITQQRQDPAKTDPHNPKFNLKYANFVKRAIIYADLINTVSERYAAEILTPEFGQGLDRLLRNHKEKVFGIINGIDYTVFNPLFDPNIYTRYDAKTIEKKAENKIKLQKELGLEAHPDIALIGMVNRLTEQKGFKLMMQAAPFLLKLKMQLVVVGTGDPEYLNFFKHLAKKYPKQIGIYSGFSVEMGAKVYAASDMYLMPSRFEPCGVSQLISLRYGSIPIVHKTGGLSDTITNFDYRANIGNGFVFNSYTSEDLLMAVTRALETYEHQDVWKDLVRRGMQESFSWDLPAKKYVQLYNIAIRKRHALSKTATPKKKEYVLV